MPHTEPVRSLILQMLQTQFLFRQAVQRKLKACGQEMTFEMLQIMVRVWKEEGVNQQTLACRTSKDKVSLTYLINNLEKRGWVMRCEDPKDKRNKLIYSTEAGKLLETQIMPVVESVYVTTKQQTDEQHIMQCITYLAELDEIFKHI